MSKKRKPPAVWPMPKPVSLPSASMQMLTGQTNPLVTITCITLPSFSSQPEEFRPFRSMGFMVERFPRGLRLVATCRHGLTSFRQKGNRCWIAFKNTRPIMLECVGAPIEDSDPNSDIAFLVVKDFTDSPTDVFDLTQGDPPFTNGEALYNAKNACEPLRGIYGIEPFRQQPVIEYGNTAFHKAETELVWRINHTNLTRQQELLDEGWIRCRNFSMVSRPGFFGSPIWDEARRLYGMNVRGSVPDKNPELGDLVICIPTSTLLAARLRVESQIQAQILHYSRA